MDGRLPGVAQQLGNLDQVRVFALVASSNRRSDNVNLGQPVLQSYQVAHVPPSRRPARPSLEVKHMHRRAGTHEAGTVLNPPSP